MNWADLISKLQNAGLSQAAIARHCGCSQSSISDLASGRTQDPRYSIACALVGLASEYERQPAKAARLTQHPEAAHGAA